MKKILKLIILLSAATFTASCAKDIVDLTGDIQGTVKEDDGGKLLENCRVALSPGGKSTWTDANGAFAFEGLEAGTYTLSFGKSGYIDATQEVSVTTGQITRANIYMKLLSATTGTISGTIKDNANGQLISNCNVSISPGGASVTSSSSGTYEFSDLAPGSYSLTFSKAGYEDANTTVTVKAGKNSTADVLIKAKSAFALSENGYDFGDMEVSKTFYFFNNSDESTSYTISNVPAWLSFNKTNGAVAASGNEAVTATVNRSSVSVGAYNQNVTISYSGKTHGTVSLSIKMQKVVLSPPAVSIVRTAENIKQTSFDISGNITATGGSEVTNYGHCWNTAGNPTINDSKTDLGTTSAICSFKSTAENLNTYTTYYVRAYAKNTQGISYSEQVAVTTQDVASDKWDGNIASSFDGGSGTNVDPYLVRTGGQLLLMKNYSSKYFKLVGNIDLDNNNWLPFDFSGSLDGAGYSVSNLKISRSDNNQGIFATLTGTVKQLTVRGVDIQAGSSNNIGAIAGILRSKGAISNCKVIMANNSVIKGNSCVGGIVGTMGNMYDSYGVNLTGCEVSSSTTSNVIMGSSKVGGIVGFIGYCLYRITIEKCHVSANICGGTLVGGVCGAGEPYSVYITNCSHYGSVGGESKVGGIYGGYSRTMSSSAIVITCCKADAKISVSDDYAGGIYGYAEGGIRVYACYSTGAMTCDNGGAKYIGGVGGFTDFDYSAQQVLCYSTVTSSHSNFGGLCGYSDLRAQDCASVVADKNERLTNCNTSCSDIAGYLKACYSEYASNYDFNSSWTWTGTVGGSSKSVKCPKLSWE